MPMWPNFSEEEAEKVASVLLSNKVNYWTGEEGRSFEREFADYMGSKYAIALSNGTVALDLALYALKIGVRNGGNESDEVIVSPRTFIASASAIVNAGAKPVFADVDLQSQNITANSMSAVLTKNTRAVMCVHLAGWPCDMDAILALAHHHNLKIIEDCAQAHGAEYRGKKIGTIGDIGCWSFCQDKIMTTGGEGGMVTTNNTELWQLMWSYKDHGKNYDSVFNKKHPPGFRWLHDSFGTNARMTEMQSAIGRYQLTRLSEWITIRNENALRINKVCSHFEFLRVITPPVDIKHACYKHYVFVKEDLIKNGWNRDRVIHELNLQNVPCAQGSCSEIYLEKAFENTGFAPKERLMNARKLGETSVMFLVHPGLEGKPMDFIVEALESVFKKIQKDLNP